MKIDVSTRELAALNVVEYLRVLVRTHTLAIVYVSDMDAMRGRLNSMSDDDRRLCIEIMVGLEGQS